MLKGKNIICISQTTWHGEFTKSTVQLLSLLAKDNNVVFIEYPFTVKDVIMSVLGKQKAQVSRMFGIKKRLQEITTDTGSKVNHLVMPPVLPVDFLKNEFLFKTFFGINAAIYKNQLLKVIKKLHMKDPIIVTAYNPMYGLPMIGKLNEFLNVYYCYDGMDTRRHRTRIFEIEENFAKKVDGIITTSDYLNSEKKKFNSNSYVVKNGVDFNLFKPFAKKDISPTAATKKVGYIGTLDQRFEIDFVEYAVKELPEIQFEFTGYLINQQIKERLSPYKNVAFYNPINAHDVPELLAKSDIGIIPYKMDEVNKNIYPLKINEYLAVGVPVVMTAFANLTDFEGIVQVANTKEDFVNHIKQELKLDNTSKIAERIAFAEKNSWEGRAIEFGTILEKFCAQKEQIK
ncbi:glycosyltransferase [Lutibacter sp.]|uniref:glycosyltransferase n=1 Tax=Lutibacter sp. TaxID=1925666 RepID=UPI0035695353